MTTMHHPPTALDLVADAFEHHEKLSFPEADLIVRRAKLTRLARDCKEFAELHAAAGDAHQAKRWQQWQAKYEARLASLEVPA